MAAITNFFKEMPLPEFERRFLDLARTDEFSAIRSGMPNQNDIEVVRRDLTEVGDVPEEWCQDDTLVCLLVGIIAGRILEAKGKLP